MTTIAIVKKRPHAWALRPIVRALDDEVDNDDAATEEAAAEDDGNGGHATTILTDGMLTRVESDVACG